MDELTTIRVRLVCQGQYGCGQSSDIDHKISKRLLEGVLSGDKHTEEAYLFGNFRCPKCGKFYAFTASKLKTMIIQ